MALGVPSFMRYASFLLLLLCSCSSVAHEPAGSSSQSLYEDDEENCGALGYACVGGRECVESRCAPAWLPMVVQDAPTPRGGAEAVSIDGKYVVFGGCSVPAGSHSQAESSAALYDPESDVWYPYPSLSRGRAYFASVMTDYGVYGVGGMSTCFDADTSHRLSSLEVMYPGSDSWLGIDPGGLSPAYSLNANFIGGMLLAFNGIQDAPASESRLLGVGSWSVVECNYMCGTGSTPSFVDGEYVYVWGGGKFYSPTRTWSSWTLPMGSSGKFSNRYADSGDLVYYVHDDHVSVYDKIGDEWLADDESSVPMGLCEEGATAWTGSEMLVWSGLCDSEYSSVGGRFQPAAPGL